MPNRIKELRKEKKLTLDALSDKVNIKRGTLNNYENEKTEPKLETWKKLADYFDVSVGYLQGLSDIKNPFKKIEDYYHFDSEKNGMRGESFDSKKFFKDGNERVAEGTSEYLTDILDLLAKQSGDDVNYNDNITNRDYRALIYDTITSLVDDALFKGIDLEYIENAKKIIAHSNNTLSNMMEARRASSKRDGKHD